MPYLPDVQTILDRGAAAELLLENPVFHAAMNDASDFHLAALVDAPEGPDGVGAREHHHRMLLAHREVVDQLRLYRSAGEEMAARIAAMTTEDDE